MRPQAGVQSALREQPPVIPLLHDAALLQHDQPIHGRDRRQSMRNGHDGLTFHQPIQTLLDDRFDLAVERARRLVEQQNRRVLHNMTRAMAIRCRCPPLKLKPRSNTQNAKLAAHRRLTPSEQVHIDDRMLVSEFPGNKKYQTNHFKLCNPINTVLRRP